MLYSFVSTVPVSNLHPLLSPPCLTTVSKECCRKPLHRRPLRTPVSHRFATLPLSVPSTLFENIRGGVPCDHNQPHLDPNLQPTPPSSRRMRISARRVLARSCRGAALLRPSLPGRQPRPGLFLPSHFVSFLIASFAFACSRLGHHKRGALMKLLNSNVKQAFRSALATVAIVAIVASGCSQKESTTQK